MQSRRFSLEYQARKKCVKRTYDSGSNRRGVKRWNILEKSWTGWICVFIRRIFGKSAWILGVSESWTKTSSETSIQCDDFRRNIGGRIFTELVAISSEIMSGLSRASYGSPSRVISNLKTPPKKRRSIASTSAVINRKWQSDDRGRPSSTVVRCT